MEILQYIAELVQSQREIGIAGLGTIYKKKSPGRYNAATRSFLPPSYTIAFKDEIADQEALSSHLASTENISLAEANDAIAAFAEQVKSQLSQYGQSNLKPLGTLKSVDGKLVLDADQDFNPGLEFFGLSKIQSDEPKIEEQETNEPEPISHVEEISAVQEVPEEAAPAEENELPEEIVVPAEALLANEVNVSEETTISEETPMNDNEEVIEEPSAQEHNTEPIEPAIVIQVNPVEEEIIIDNLLEEENPGNETHEPQLIEVQTPLAENSINYTIQESAEPKKSEPLMVKVVLSVLALVVLGIIAYVFYPKATEPEVKPSAIVVDSANVRKDSLQKVADQNRLQDSVAGKDSLNNTKQLVGETPVQDSITNLAADTSTVYEIIGASVLNQKEADWFITQMKRNGIKAKVVKNIPGKRLKMSIATLNDEKTAKSERDRLEKKLDIKGIYIYRNKKE